MLETLRADRAELWRVRLYYFLFIGAAGSLMPFLNLFLERSGLSGTQIGLLATLSSLGALVAAPAWGRRSDRARHPRRLLQASLLGSALVMLVLSQQTLFAWMAVLVAVNALVGAAVGPLSDSLALAVTHGDEQSGFGSVRLWGSLGWAVLALVTGWLIERIGLIAAFAGNAALAAAGVAILATMTTDGGRTRLAEAALRPRLRAVLAGLLRDRAMVGLAIALIILLLTSSGYHQFEAIYLDQLGAGESIIGLVNMVGALIELPFMWWADSLMRRYGSHNILRASFALNLASMLVVLAAPSVTSIIVQRAIGGVAYSFYAVALTVFISERAPEGQRATALALYLVTLQSLIGIVSGPLGGLAFDAFGAYWLYAMALGGYALAWLVLRLTVTGRRSRRES